MSQAMIERLKSQRGNGLTVNIKAAADSGAYWAESTASLKQLLRLKHRKFDWVAMADEFAKNKSGKALSVAEAVYKLIEPYGNVAMAVGFWFQNLEDEYPAPTEVKAFIEAAVKKFNEVQDDL